MPQNSRQEPGICFVQTARLVEVSCLKYKSTKKSYLFKKTKVSKCFPKNEDCSVDNRAEVLLLNSEKNFAQCPKRAKNLFFFVRKMFSSQR